MGVVLRVGECLNGHLVFPASALSGSCDNLKCALKLVANLKRSSSLEVIAEEQGEENKKKGHGRTQGPHTDRQRQGVGDHGHTDPSQCEAAHGATAFRQGRVSK